MTLLINKNLVNEIFSDVLIFAPVVIRRRKKEKRRGVGGGLCLLEQDEASCLGSETQWLPTGLLSAESESPDTRSDTATSDTEEELEEGETHKKSKSAKRRTHRKLGGTLSVPTYPSFQLRLVMMMVVLLLLLYF